MATTTERYVGQPVLRKEDPELLTGRGRYTDDLSVTGMLWMSVVRSPFAHARIKGVDVSKALEVPGVVAAFSGGDFEWAGPLLMAWPVTDDLKNAPHMPLTTDKARYQGDGVAVVIAESRAAAMDGAEVVDVDYDPLPAVTDVEVATEHGAPIVHDDFGTNESYTWSLTNGNVDEVFGQDHDLRRRMRPVLKKYLAADDELDAEVRNKMKNLQEGTRTWEVEYQKIKNEIQRRKGLV